MFFWRSPTNLVLNNLQTMQSVIAPTESGLALAVRGRGPDAVLIHGSLGDYRQWNAIVERLESNYRVIAVSRRHHWPNPPPQPDISYTYEGHRADLQLFLHAIGHPTHVVGHSYGAGVALLAALHDGESIRSLTLIEPAFGSLLPAATPGLAPELTSRESMVATVKAFVQEGDNERAAEALIDWVQAGAGGFSQLTQTVRDGLLANAKTIGPNIAAPAPTLTCDELSVLHVPTLVLNGERTRMWYRLIGRAVAACVPGAQAATIEAAGHMAIVENPTQTSMLLTQFIAEN
jgi:pimeloyl-ACP methyl ester carboxylesterase